MVSQSSCSNLCSYSQYKTVPVVSCLPQHLVSFVFISLVFQEDVWWYHIGLMSVCLCGVEIDLWDVYSKAHIFLSLVNFYTPNNAHSNHPLVQNTEHTPF